MFPASRPRLNSDYMVMMRLNFFDNEINLVCSVTVFSFPASFPPGPAVFNRQAPRIVAGVREIYATVIQDLGRDSVDRMRMCNVKGREKRNRVEGILYRSWALLCEIISSCLQAEFNCLPGQRFERGL